MHASIKFLLGVHALLLPVAAFGALGRPTPHPIGVLLQALVVSDTGLLALWSALGMSPWQMRMFGGIVGLSCLAATASIATRGQLAFYARELLSAAAQSQDRAMLWYEVRAQILAMAVSVMVPAMVLFLIFRQLRRSRNGLQFSIAQIFMLTAAVAAACSIRAAFRAFNYDPSYWLSLAPIVLVNVPCFVSVELAAIWAALASRRPLVCLPGLAIFATLVGFVPPLCLFGRADAKWFLIWPAILTCQATLAFATLLVFRGSDWKLRRVAEGHVLVFAGDRLDVTDS